LPQWARLARAGSPPQPHLICRTLAGGPSAPGAMVSPAARAVAVLTDAGFGAPEARRALRRTGGNVDAAAEALLRGSAPSGGSSGMDGALATLVEMGFDSGQARRALAATHGRLDRATDLLLTGAVPPDRPPAPHAPPRRRRDGDLACSGTSARAPAATEAAGAAAGAAPHSCACAPPAHVPPEAPSRPAKRPRLERPAAAGLDAATQAAPGPGSSPPGGSSSSAASAPAEAAAGAGAAPPASAAAGGSAEERPLGLEALAAGLVFGRPAFGPLRPRGGGHRAKLKGPSLRSRIPDMLRESVAGVESMRGERGLKTVTQMLTDSYSNGLFMHGPPSSAVNRQIVPALRHVFAEMAKLPPEHPKRVGCLTALAEACTDCQQVQAREILRLFGDLTSQSETFEGQLRYSLLRAKEAALNCYITGRHPGCDLDHTRAQPWQQRAHLVSGYTWLLGEAFGLDGLEAAGGDRFLPQVLEEIGAVDPAELQRRLVRGLSVKEWLQTLLADVNNQARPLVCSSVVDPGCIFKWVSRHLSQEAAHEVFYDEERLAEFEGQDPERPTKENQFQPFLSCRVLVDMLLATGMLERA
ncbi:unnamed protein product, partial [Prorocentrum cordatum]